MNTKQLALEALKQAVELLYSEPCYTAGGDPLSSADALNDQCIVKMQAAIAALEADLSQPVEPVLYCISYDGKTPHDAYTKDFQTAKNTRDMVRGTAVVMPLYTATEPAGWQPIATAPKDGTKYLAYSKDRGYFVENQPPKFYAGEWDFNEKRKQWRGHAHSDGRSATYWAPLPPAPKDAS